MLELRNVIVRFSGLVAVDGVSLDVREGEIHSLIGPNGAGKSTIINTVTGLYQATGGEIRFAGESIQGRPMHQIARLGLARTFQNTELFGEFTALENLLVGLDGRFSYGVVPRVLGLPVWKRREHEAREAALELLRTVGIEDLAHKKAGDLPFGLRRRLEIARALATRPRLLLLDEPAAGLRLHEILELNQVLVDLRDRFKLAILLVDHVMKVVMSISDRITVINFGRHVATGLPDDIRANPNVVAAYLGQGSSNA